MASAILQTSWVLWLSQERARQVRALARVAARAQRAAGAVALSGERSTDLRGRNAVRHRRRRHGRGSAASRRDYAEPEKSTPTTETPSHGGKIKKEVLCGSVPPWWFLAFARRCVSAPSPHLLRPRHALR